MPGVHAQSWLDAIAQPSVRFGLEAIYAELHEEVAARVPVCQASGRCCKFESYGHRLYVTGIEAAYTVSQLADHWIQPTINQQHIDNARTAGGCPFQLNSLCSVHTIKPLGCRIYFCDPTAQDWQQELHEQLIAKLRVLHDEHSIAYQYSEWRTMLEYFC